MEASVTMLRTSENHKTSATSLLPIYRTDVRQMFERSGTWRPQGEGGVWQEEPRYKDFLCLSLSFTSRVADVDAARLPAFTGVWAQACFGDAMDR